MKQRRRKKRSAIVPAAVFAAGLCVAAAAVVPSIVGCSDNTMMVGVAAVAFQGFDMTRQDMPMFSVANLGFDMALSD